MADNQQNSTVLAIPARRSIIEKFSERYEVDASKVMSIVASTVFRQAANEPPLSNEEIAAALIVVNQYNLNPFTKEIYAFRSKGKLLIIVGVDGWSAIVNRQPEFNGVEFEEHFDDSGNIQAVTARIHRKDRALPTVVTEYTRECRRDTIPWNTMPIRMTRNRAFVQCARIAFSISGIIEEDEAQTIQGAPEFSGPVLDIPTGTTRTETVKAAVQHRKQAKANGQAQQEPATTTAQIQESAKEAEDESRHQSQQVVETQQAQAETQAQPSGELW